jgi:hypothetical protein
MAINFPNSPVNNEEYTENGKTWIWYATPGYWSGKANIGLSFDTYGAYVSNVIGGNGIVVTGNDGSEGAVPNVTLSPTGITAASYGTTTSVGTFTVDTWGRLSSAANTAIDFNYANVTNRPVANIILVGNITGQANAVLTSSQTLFLISANVGLNSVTLGAHTIGAYVSNVISGNGIVVTGNDGSEGAVPNVSLQATGVTAASYGTTTSVGTFTVDQWGRLSVAADTAINFNYANVTNRPVANIILVGNITGQANAVLTPDSTTFLISANVSADSVTLGTHTIGAYVANVISGNGIVVTGNDGSEGAVPNVTLSPTGVTATTYGNATIVPVITVDTWGRISNTANTTLELKTVNGTSLLGAGDIQTTTYATFVANTTNGANITLSGSNGSSSNVELTGNNFITLLRTSNSSIMVSTRSNITVGTTAPSSPTVNDLWIDTN